MYKSKEEIQEKIDKYFEECEGKVLEDKDGNPILNKYGGVIIMGSKPPTIRENKQKNRQTRRKSRHESPENA